MNHLGQQQLSSTSWFLSSPPPLSQLSFLLCCFQAQLNSFYARFHSWTTSTTSSSSPRYGILNFMELLIRLSYIKAYSSYEISLPRIYVFGCCILVIDLDQLLVSQLLNLSSINQGIVTRFEIIYGREDVNGRALKEISVMCHP